MKLLRIGIGQRNEEYVTIIIMHFLLPQKPSVVKHPDPFSFSGKVLDTTQKKQRIFRNTNTCGSIRIRSYYGWAVASLQAKVHEADQGLQILWNHFWDYLLILGVSV